MDLVTNESITPGGNVVRIGLGYDSHRLGQGGPLRIGGVDIPSPFHAIGHSDADVLLHAITDALLGALCLPDIGRLFPDDDPANANRDSADFLIEALRQIREQGFELVNLDAVILAQKPKMAPHLDAMRQRIAKIASWDANQIGLKAKTGEGVGEIGTSQAIATRVVVLLARLNENQKC